MCVPSRYSLHVHVLVQLYPVHISTALLLYAAASLLLHVHILFLVVVAVMVDGSASVLCRYDLDPARL